MGPAWRLPVLAAVALATAGGLQGARPYPPYTAGPPSSPTSLDLRWAPTECVAASHGGPRRTPASQSLLTCLSSLPLSHRVVGYDVEAKETARGAGWEVVRRPGRHSRAPSPPAAALQS